MLYEDIKDFYQMLEVSRDADTASIKVRLEEFEQKKRQELIDPVTMRAAARAIDELPGIREALLSGAAQRQAYDQRLAEAEGRRTQGDALRLDEPFITAFYFDRHNNLDTEEPALNMRALVEKLERDWSKTRDWLCDTSQSKHPLVLFVKYHSSPRPLAREALVRRLETELFQKIATMHHDEAVERCLSLLNPQIKRPTLTVKEISDPQSQTLYLREFMPGETRPAIVVVAHEGERGCLFGTVESQTEWLKLSNGQTQQRFALLAEKIATPNSSSSLNLPLFFDLWPLARNRMHQATLVFHVENYEPSRDIRVNVALKVLPVPPRVTFEPASTLHAPLLVGTTRRGIVASQTVIPRNAGDEQLIPLAARLYCTEPGVRLNPPLARANTPVTITVETHDRQQGGTYSIPVQVDYSATPGATGPRELYIQGEVLPTLWQSMLRTKSLAQRNSAGMNAAVGGLLSGGFVGALAAFVPNLFVIWLILLALLFIALARLSATTITTHLRLSGDTQMDLKHVSPFILWVVPAVTAALLLLPDLWLATVLSIITGAAIGVLVGYAVGFTTD
ncbi:MAG TPA: hypothetical protein VEL31_11170 [Ktedonobacteraceae bacterium]|nr:hypothetical protein [Ktedonobacteraceae bacterium]